ncbi:Gfo/Idh/MocA family oxidoreductase [Arachidicoccus ginsenosidivorans]
MENLIDINGQAQVKLRTPAPKKPVPIIIIGAGGIVRDAHLPAYTSAGLEVFGIVNRTRSKAAALAKQFSVPHVFDSVEAAVKAAPKEVVYDIALMPDQYLATLQALPDGATVLIQKPMGESLDEAAALLQLCQQKKLTAAINCQLRYAPFVHVARQMIDQRLLGEIYDMEVRLTTYTPWEIFPHVAVNKRLEILYHSIHYMDLIRSFLGEPESIVSKTFGHPAKTFSSTRTTTIFSYGQNKRAVISTNHDHNFGPDEQESFIKWEGTKGVIKAKMGLLLDYPTGVADQFDYCLLSEQGTPRWHKLDIKETWFPDAFRNIMYALQRYREGSDTHLPNLVQDVYHTMELVEAAYQSNKLDGHHTAVGSII